MFTRSSLFGAAALLWACSHEAPPPSAQGATAAHTATEPHEHGVSKHASHDDEEAEEAPSSKKDTAGGRTRETGYAVPFVWQTSHDDPLAVARGHLRQIIEDNEQYLRDHSRADLTGDKSQARATILTCADAAMQMNALDATPENDAFVVRNLGNVLNPSLASVTYGIYELHTPVLLIVGHTGCEAVKAALEGTASSGRLRAQLAQVKVIRTRDEVTEQERIDRSVRYNVNKQVAKAVSRFEALVHTGALTVVGAVYDPHNSMKQGAGRLSIINVNSITDPESMRAFVSALTSDDKIVLQQAAPESHHSASAHDGETHAAHGAGSEHTPDAVSPRRPQPQQIHEPSSASAHSPGQAAAHPSQPSSHPGHEAQAEAPAHGLPQIDHLEASLVGHPHREAADGPSHHGENIDE